MNKLSLSAFLFLTIIFFGFSNSSRAQVTTYSVSGSYTYNVPAAIWEVTVNCAGASGGKSANNNAGGKGGHLTCILAVTPGMPLYTFVGGVGGAGCYCGTPAGGADGGGGGNGGSGSGGGGGGGGSSDVRIGGNALANRVLVAAGGGGGAYDCGEPGGAAGGASGVHGTNCGYFYSSYDGGGASQTSGGSGAYYAQWGGPGYGGYAYSYLFGGGGGGGYYGGGGGYYGSGGGGSSYPITGGTNAYATSVTNTGNFLNAHAGYVTFRAVCIGAPISGTKSTCAGFTTQLSNPNAGGVWSSTNNAVGTVDPSLGIVTGVSLGTTTISYVVAAPCGTTVGSSAVVTVVAPPAAITGNSPFCQTYNTTLSSSSGGTGWSSSNNSVATVSAGSPTTGIVSGVNAGTAMITYSVSSTCFVTASIAVLPTMPVTGTMSVCQGLTTNLSEGIPGGTWSSGNTTIGTVTPVTGVVYGVSVGGVLISYTQPNGCQMNANITVNPLPSAISGTLGICQGLSTTLTDAGGTWSSASNGAVASIGSSTGVMTGVSAGTDAITYTLPTGCLQSSLMTVNPLPAAIVGNGVCINLKGQLTDPTPGGTWSSSNMGLAMIGSTSGIDTGIIVGNLIMTYTLVSTGCIMTTPFNVNPLPAPITGPQIICAGTSAYLSDMSGGGAGIYSTLSPALSIGGSGITGLITGVSPGTAIVTYTLPTGCIITTTETVTTSPSVITGGSTPICSGRTASLVSIPGGGTWTSSNPFQLSVDPVLGTATGVSAGNPMITYTLPDGCQSFLPTTVNNSPAPISGNLFVCKNASTMLFDGTPGGSWSSPFSGLVAVNASTGLVNGLSPGNPTISYTLPVTGCWATVSFSVNALPAVEVLSGGGGYCVGDSGVHIMLGPNSQSTVRYNLFNGSDSIGSIYGNTGVLDFGLITAQGTYTVQATTNSGCTANFPTSEVVTINPLPLPFNLTLPFGGNYCDGSGGVDISLDSSENLTNYYLILNGNPVAYTFLPGSGHPMDYGTNLYPAGTYTALAVDDVTGCQNNMIGSAMVNVNTLPDVDTVIGGGNYCPYASGVHVGLDYSSPGIEYTLWNGGDSVTSTSGASSALDFGLQTTGTYTVTATNPLTGCTNVMYSSATVGTNPTPNTFPIGVIGSGKYCNGADGVELYLYPSDIGASYQVYHLNEPIGLPAVGTGDTTFLGMETLDSTYTVVGTFVSTGCYAAMTGVDTVSIEPLPVAYPLTGGGPYCFGDTGVAIGLGNSDNGISYQILMGGAPADTAITGAGTAINFGTYTTPGNYTVLATNISTGCQANMPGMESVSINSLPAVYNVVGGGSYCAGGLGVHVDLDHSATGIQYTLFNGTTAVVSLMGSNSELDFGAQTVAGNYKVLGTNTVTGCKNMMNDSQAVVVNPQPTLYTVSSTSSSYCVGGPGVHINLSGSDSLLSYQLYLNGIPVSGPVTGLGSALDFGPQTGVGAYTVIASNLASACSATMAESPAIAVNPLPQAFNVTGGGGYCSGGTGVSIGLNSSTAGFTYQLFNSSGAMVSTVTSTGGALSFSNQSGAGWYKAIAINPATTCMNNMFDSALVNINPVPSVYALTGGGGYCDGSTGTHVGLLSSQSGISYQLYNGSTLAATVSGSTGSSIDFGLFTATGSYSVVATDMATGCTNQMSGVKTISVNPLPPVYTMFGGGGYCAGTPGVHVNLSGSTLGLNYQLYYAGTAIGSAVSGTGAALDFGAKTEPGDYTVIVTDPLTLCTRAMNGISSVVINPLPRVYNVTGGGNYCTGTLTGAAIGLDNSDIGFGYQVYLGTTAVGVAASGAGMPINLGSYITPGTYSVVSRNNLTGCVIDMAGGASIVENPVVTPGVSLSTGMDVNVCAGTVLTVTASPANGGLTPAYVWKVNGVTSGTGNTYTYVPSDGDMVTATLTSSAPCASPLTAVATTLVGVAPYETPVASTVASPGSIVCNGTPVTFTATTSYGGNAPVYTWLKNSASVGNGLSYTYTPANGDVLEFMLQSNLPCRTADIVFSNTILVEADQPLTPVVTLFAVPGTGITPGEAVTLHADAVNAGTSPVYQWYLNGAAIAGANGQTLESSNFANLDSISCVVSTGNVCGPVTATNSLILSVGTLGVNQLSAGNGENISVIPNPSNGTFTIKGNIGVTVSENVTIEITDVVGQVVYSEKAKAVNGDMNEQVQLNNVANGMYLLNLHTNEGVTVFHIVVEK